MTTSNPTTLNTQGQVPGLSIRDVVRLLAFQLRGTTHKVDNGYVIELRNYTRNLHTVITLTRSLDDEGSSNLAIESRKLKEKVSNFVVNYINLQHLYISWEKPGQVSFCYVNEGRFTLLNVSYDQGVRLINGQDKRIVGSFEVSEFGVPKIPKERRTFYHIGKLFDKPVEETEEDEDVASSEPVPKGNDLSSRSAPEKNSTEQESDSGRDSHRPREGIFSKRRRF